MDTPVKHGHTRFFGIQRVSSGPEIELTDPSGETVYKGSGSSTEETIAQSWCEHCQQWIQTNGVMGPLKFLAQHQDGDCQKVQS